MPQKVYANLPAYSVDLDHASVSTLAAEIEDQTFFHDSFPCILDSIIDAGVISIAHTDGHIEDIHWGRTAPNEHGVYDVLIDTPMVTLTALRALWVYNVIGDEFPDVA